MHCTVSINAPHAVLSFIAMKNVSKTLEHNFVRELYLLHTYTYCTIMFHITMRRRRSYLSSLKHQDWLFGVRPRWQDVCETAAGYMYNLDPQQLYRFEFHEEQNNGANSAIPTAIIAM